MAPLPSPTSSLHRSPPCRALSRRCWTMHLPRIAPFSPTSTRLQGLRGHPARAVAEGRRGAWSQAERRWPGVSALVCFARPSFTSLIHWKMEQAPVSPLFCPRITTSSPKPTSASVFPPHLSLAWPPPRGITGVLCLTFPCLLQRRPFSTSDRVGSCLWEPHPWDPCTRHGPGHRFALPFPAQLPGSLCRVRGRYRLYHWQLSLPKPTRSLNSLPALPALDSARAEPQPGTSRGPLYPASVSGKGSQGTRPGPEGLTSPARACGELLEGWS